MRRLCKVTGGEANHPGAGARVGTALVPQASRLAGRCRIVGGAGPLQSGGPVAGTGEAGPSGDGPGSAGLAANVALGAGPAAIVVLGGGPASAAGATGKEASLPALSSAARTWGRGDWSRGVYGRAGATRVSKATLCPDWAADGAGSAVPTGSEAGPWIRRQRSRQGMGSAVAGVVPIGSSSVVWRAPEFESAGASRPPSANDGPLAVLTPSAASSPPEDLAALCVGATGKAALGRPFLPPPSFLF